MTSVRVDGLCKVFGAHPADALRRSRAGVEGDRLRAEGATVAVLDASFTVEPGEIFVVMGLSGSGKSTLIRMLNGLLAPTEGRVYVDEEDVTALTGRALRELRQRTMSMVFQHFALLPHRTVRDNVEYGPRIQGAAPARARERADEALRMVGLTGWEQRFPQQLSGGMRQRVGLARALAAGTDVLLMDEAFSALDPLIKRDMQDQLVQLQAELGKTIVFITHDLNEAMRLGDRIAVMRAGRIVQLGTASEILRRPADSYVARFVRDVDRGRVLTAGAIAERSADPDRQAADAVPAQTPLHELFGRVAETAGLPVVDAEGRVIGTVGPSAVLRALGDGGRTEAGDG
ncbi:quaternary amine ABC transporter ATP-binding protein [Saccharopolyspora gloriosae]|uniref:Glycine betaine/proline transport system ATP-binding protein n=1 Tax=Saccharopolyspora gloriosae TaxID=455344 RepID=A0A840NET2_9PSEU|nr:glycine betaine/proline transport system ATP-binding protein [Saccharopolyspora gloriosae]